jgi:hypothetical protein
MDIVIGPVLRRADGYRFDTWTAGKGMTRGYPYRRVEDAHYARNRGETAGPAHVVSPAASRRPDRYSSRSSGLRQGRLLGTTKG